MPRVSTAQLYDRTKDGIANAQEKQAETALKASSMKEVNRPSEDPRAWAIAKQLKDDLNVKETLARNAALAKQMLGTTESVFTRSTEYLERAYELGLGAVGKDRRVLDATLTEVEQLYETTLQTLNTQYGDRTLLAGFRSDRAALDEKGRFQGDEGRIEIELERGKKFALNGSSEEAVLGGAEGDGVHIPKLFHRLIQGLKEGDEDLIRNTFPDFQKAVGQLILERTKIGAKMNRIDRAIDSYELEKIDQREVIAHLEEADAIKVFTDLARDQTALQATLDSSTKLLREVRPDKLFR